MDRKQAPLGKITRPAATGVQPRERLFARLDAGCAGPAVWVCGPPGSGKTMLLASWLERSRLTSLWYQVDDGDTDVATLFYYLRLAAAEAAPQAAQSLPLLMPEYQAGLPVFARRFFQALYACLGERFAIVFDGYHEAGAASVFHEVMREALRAMPQGGTAIILSRGDPPPALARLRASSALALVDWDMLRLTREESRVMVDQRVPRIAEELAESLFQRTQGWAAGLVLLLEQSMTGGAIAQTPDLSARQVVFDYLAGEVLQHSEPHIQTFLLRTAHLPQMSAAMAQALTAEERAESILDELHRRNYFVTRGRTGGEYVYQYHPMFREFLLARVQESSGKEQRRRQQRESALQLEARGYVEDAFALFRDSHEWEEASRVIGEHATSMLAQGRGETLAHWVEDLPPEIRARNPWMAYWVAASRAQVSPREARVLYEQAFEQFRARQDARGMVLACSGAMDAILYELDDFSLLDRWIAVLDETGVQSLQAVPQDEARVACSMFFSLTLRQPQRRDIEQWIARALSSAHRVDDVNVRMFVGLLAALTVTWTGHHGRAVELIDAVRAIAGAPGVTPFSRITLNNLEAMHAMLVADRAAGMRAMREGLEIARQTGVHTWSFQLLVYGYGAALGAQDLAGAAGLAKELEAASAGAGRFNLCLYRHFQAWEAALRKDLMQALQLERAALRMAVEVGCPFFEVLCRLALAQILGEVGDERKCIAHLQQLRAIAREIDNRHLEFTCLVGFADLGFEHGRERPALNALRHGFQIARHNGYRHFLWWRPAAVARVCVRALAAGVEVDYARSLVRTRELVPDTPPLWLEAWPWPYRIHAFGTFEVLRYGEPLPQSGKAQRRPLDLLKALIALGGERVDLELLAGALWPRIDGDSAHRSLTSALHRLRKLLGDERSLVLHEGRLSLDRRRVWTDVWAFESACAELEASLKNDDEAARESRVEGLAQRMLLLYRGPFLAADADAEWNVGTRERLRSRYGRVMAEAGRYWEKADQADRAADCYVRCLESEPLAEVLYRRLMDCYLRQGRRAEATDAFDRCRKALAASGLQPAPETRALLG